ncbi:MAG: SIMPL domain-containing protein [Myxococcales bacterium]
MKLQKHGFTRARIRAIPSMALALSALALGSVGCAHGHAHGHHHHGAFGKGGMGMSGISVVGVGEVKTAPNIARTNVGVEARAAQADQATAEANQRMAAVISALKAAGIAESDLRTHSLSVSFEREYQPPPAPPAPVEAAPAKAGAGKVAPTAVVAPAPAAVPEGFYRVSNMVEVTIRDLNRASQVLSAATNAGANQLWGISFEVEDTKPLVADARAKAVAHAKQVAEQLQQLTGVKLGPIVAITDGAAAAGPMPMFAAARADMAAGGGSMPVERGELTVTHQVTVLYSLDAGDDHAPGH